MTVKLTICAIEIQDQGSTPPQNKLAKLTKQVEILSRKVDKNEGETQQLRNRFDRIENHTRNVNIRFYNLPVKSAGESEETLKQFLKEILGKMKIPEAMVDKLSSKFLDVIHRVDGGKAMIARFTGQKHVKYIMSHRRNLDSTVKLGPNLKAVSVQNDYCKNTYDLNKKSVQEVRKLRGQGKNAKVIAPGKIVSDGTIIFI
ncbi:MAG: hypothetical protein GY738_14320 [Pseudoalteromonas sp.]|nr:hypothetical protein [Pseudoalteromonas sp.]